MRDFIAKAWKDGDGGGNYDNNDDDDEKQQQWIERQKQFQITEHAILLY